MKAMENIWKFSSAELINSLLNTVWVYRYINMIPGLQLTTEWNQRIPGSLQQRGTSILKTNHIHILFAIHSGIIPLSEIPCLLEHIEKDKWHLVFIQSSIMNDFKPYSFPWVSLMCLWKENLKI